MQMIQNDVNDQTQWGSIIAGDPILWNGKRLEGSFARASKMATRDDKESKTSEYSKPIMKRTYDLNSSLRVHGLQDAIKQNIEQ